MNDILENIIEQESCFNFSDEWLQVADYELKILILTSILAENNLAYRGKLSDICEWLGVKSYNKTNQKIKEAINSLQEQGYLFYKLDGRTYTLTISEKGMKEKQIIKIRKAWVSAFKAYKNKNNSVDWIKILKVFVYLYNRKSSSIIQADIIASDLNIGATTVSRALKAICECELSGIKVTKKILKERYKTEKCIYYYTLGTDISMIIMF